MGDSENSESGNWELGTGPTLVLTLPPASFPLHPLWRCVHFLPVTFVSQTGRGGWWWVVSMGRWAVLSVSRLVGQFAGRCQQLQLQLL